MPPTVGSALNSYRNALQVLEDKNPLTAEQSLEILCARDALQFNLASDVSIAPACLQSIYELDTQLKQNAQRLTKALDLSTYRNSLPKKPDVWWWYLDEQQPPHPIDRYDWVCNGLTFGGWTASIALLINIASRFFSGGPDVVGAIAVILPTLLALLQAKNSLTEDEQQRLNKLLKRLKIPIFLHAEAKFVSAFTFFIVLILFWFQLPQISKLYGKWGLADHNARELSSAERKYKRAIALDPDNVNAHNNLGQLYENWLRLDEAKQEYQVAVKGEVIRAYNNLARLYIQDGKDENNPEAVSLLLGGLKLVKEQQFLPKNKRSFYPEDQYNLLKNLGWVRFEQNRDEEAKTALEEAINIAKDPEVPQKLPNRASAHCLLAQVLEHQKQPTAIEQWQQCKALGNPEETPEEDTWMHLAEQALQTSQNQNPTP